MKNPLLYLFLSAVMIALSCTNAAEPSPHNHQHLASGDSTDQGESVAGNFSDQVQYHFDSTAIEIFLKKYPGFNAFRKDLIQFYRQRNYAYAWYDAGGLIEQAQALYNRTQQLNEEGIKDSLLYQSAFDALMDKNDSTLLPEPMNAEAELLLTSQYFNYARKVWQGLPDSDIKKMEWYVPRKKLNLPQLMDSLLYDSDKSFIAREPVYRQYGLLKSYLVKYKTIREQGRWPMIPAVKKSLRPGDSSNIIRLLRQRLWNTGDLAGDTSSYLFDHTLEEAVVRFQRRNGLKEEAIINSSLIGELNTPIDKIITQLLVNMERCRWVPADPQNEYIVVNIPAFKLYLYNNDSLLWDMNIVAGTPVHKTTIFTGKLSQVVFSPYWNVPPGILKNEILPGIRRDPGYLRKLNMEWIGHTVRQKPGPGNSLGNVKFLFPNSYSIYFHDTPAKNLFKEDNRAFSHGCIRLAEPKKLAMYLLRNDENWPASKIDAAMNAGREQYVSLKEPIPVFIVYFTAWVNRQGELNLRKDVYKRDERLAKMFMVTASEN